VDDRHVLLGVLVPRSWHPSLLPVRHAASISRRVGPVQGCGVASLDRGKMRLDHSEKGSIMRHTDHSSITPRFVEAGVTLANGYSHA
jgi:hypothetical protein